VNGVLWAIFAGIPQAISTTLALIVIACPCALGLAMPLAIARFQSCAALRGIFVRRPDAIARCESINEVIFDKTGTLTRGAPVIAQVLPGQSLPEHERIEALSALLKLELGSVHPAAVAIANWCKAQEIKPSSDLEASPLVDGSGVEGADGAHFYCVGGFQVLASHGLEAHGRAIAQGFDDSLSASFFLRDSEIIYTFGLKDEPVPSLDILLAKFSEHANVSLLSGDRAAVTREFGKRFGFLDERLIAEASPEQKKRYVEVLSRTSRGVLFIGDGANDAPAMTAATLSYGLHGGAEACLSSSDAYISTGSLRDAWELFRRSKQALRFMRGLLYFSVSYNVVGALLAVSGIASPLVAAIFMPVSSFTVIAATRFWSPFGRGVSVRW
jgi:P-type E1-E2 ATPase